MRKFLIAAGLAAAVAGLMNVPRAEAMTFSLPPGMANQLNIIEQVALCFYIDGWNGPGMYECGYRYRRGYGWHGPREERREYYEHRRGYDDDRRHRCPRGYTVQDGVCKPYRGY